MNVPAKVRQEYDITFMQLIATVRATVMAVKPAETQSPIAAMFFKEAVQGVLRELAELTAAWNKSYIDFASIDRALKGLNELGLDEMASKLAQLKEL